MTRASAQPHATTQASSGSKTDSLSDGSKDDGGAGTASTDTPQRILQAAGRIFAEHGYRSATVRQICEGAGANVAAINYHFGDKQGLYDQVLRHAFASMSANGSAGHSDDDRDGAVDTAPPRERLRAMIRTLIQQLLGHDEAAIYIRLVARELMDPTPTLERLIDEGIRPQVARLLEIVSELLGPDARRPQVRRCAASILGQCLFYCVGRPIITRLPLEDDLGPATGASLADHIAEFSLAGIESIGRRAD